MGHGQHRGHTERPLEAEREVEHLHGQRDAEREQGLVAQLVSEAGRDLVVGEQLGVGGRSYGGILTNYVIASDTRFKAAVSGAGAGATWPGSSCRLGWRCGCPSAPRMGAPGNWRSGSGMS